MQFNLDAIAPTPQAEREMQALRKRYGDDTTTVRLVQLVSDQAEAIVDKITAATFSANPIDPAPFKPYILQTERQKFIDTVRAAGLTKQKAVEAFDALKAAGVKFMMD